MARAVRLLVALLVSVAAVPLGPGPAYTSAVAALAVRETCSRSAFGSTGSSCGRQLGWTYDASNATLTARGKRVGSLDGKGSPFEYVIGSRCQDETFCGAAAFTCPRVDNLAGIRYRALAFALDAGGNRLLPPVSDASVCDYPGRSVPLSAVQAAVHEELRKRIPSPSVTSAPPGVSLVNLLTIFSTTPAAEQAIAFAQPVPGEVRAVPEYTWDFGDGIHGVGPGKPFTSSVLPSKNPEYYTGAKYTQPGTKHVTLTVTWRVTFRLEGVQDIPLQPIVMTASEDKQIATARGVLVN